MKMNLDDDIKVEQVNVYLGKALVGKFLRTRFNNRRLGDPMQILAPHIKICTHFSHFSRGWIVFIFRSEEDASNTLKD